MKILFQSPLIHCYCLFKLGSRAQGGAHSLEKIRSNLESLDQQDIMSTTGPYSLEKMRPNHAQMDLLTDVIFLKNNVSRFIQVSLLSIVNLSLAYQLELFLNVHIHLILVVVYTVY